MKTLIQRNSLIATVLFTVSSTLTAGCGPEATPSELDDAISCQQNRLEESQRESEALTHSGRYIVKLRAGNEEGADTSKAADIGTIGADSGARYVQDLFMRTTENSLAKGAPSEEPEVDSIDESTYSVRLTEDLKVDDVLEGISGEPGVEYVEPDYPVYSLEQTEFDSDIHEDSLDALSGELSEPETEGPLDVSSLMDPLTPRQWAHRKIGSFGAWQVTPGSRKVIVAVIDSGVDYNHPDLKANIWRNPGEIAGNGVDDDGNGYVDDVYGWDFKDGNNRPLPGPGRSFHGTHVAGTVGAVGGNGIGITGHAPQVQIMALRFLGDNGGFTSDAVRAINYAVKNGARIINASYGSGNVSRAQQDAIERAGKAGVLMVAAAGNAGNNISNRPMYPAAYSHPNLLVVGASDQNDRMPAWSNYSTARVDVAAPGKGIYSTKTNAQYASLNGTSMATPLVSGLAALIASIRPDYRADRLKSTILSTADKLPSLRGRVLTGGRVNAQRALASASKGAVFPVPDGGGVGSFVGDPCAFGAKLND